MQTSGDFIPFDPHLEATWRDFKCTVQSYVDEYESPRAARLLAGCNQFGKWMLHTGHGTALFSAVEHNIGEHLKTESVLKTSPAMLWKALQVYLQRRPWHGQVTVYCNNEHVLKISILEYIKL